MDDTFSITWYETGAYRELRFNGHKDVADFIETSIRYNRRIITIRNETFALED